ncbi:hypothetical protein INT45_003492 [Circinella minor]|uniref:Uncharacterized protein n=1 Tax=Circinella minor TaxID=1195481 RepID=A0A8H7S955_9FUNG|nr:hypothetical protein INT45_003492 [Circinella minor]
MTDTNSINEQFQKPNTIDSPIYDKPNAYEDGIVYDRPHEKDEQPSGESGVAIETVIQLAIGHNKRPVSPVSPTNDNQENLTEHEQKQQLLRHSNEGIATTATIPKGEVEANKNTVIDINKNYSTTTIGTSSSYSSSQSHNSSDTFVTASVLSHAPTTTTAASVNDELVSPLSYMSLRRNTYTSSLTNLSPSTSTSSRDSSKQLLFNSLESTKDKKKKKKGIPENMLIYELRKHALNKPQMHDIYPYGSKTVAYRKVQPHSYSWGFQNILYRGAEKEKESDEGESKVAETRRRAFEKDIVIECGKEQNEIINKTKSHLMFVYETTYEGYWIRWRRPSLLSHNMTCEIAPIEEIPADGQRRRRNWKLMAEFDSHRMGYLIHLGKLAIDQTAVELFDDTELIEAHLLISCCTLVDLMREVVEKAVGIGEGGIASSN